MANERAFMSFVMRLADQLSTVQGQGAPVGYSPIDFQVELNNNTSPLIDNVYAATLALAAGSATIDLTALVWPERSNLDLTGKKVYGFYVLPLGANDLTIVSAAANGYDMFTATNGHVIAGGGKSPMMQYNNGGYAVVSGSAKDLTVTGTGTETFVFALMAGV